MPSHGSNDGKPSHGSNDGKPSHGSSDGKPSHGSSDGKPSHEYSNSDGKPSHEYSNSDGKPSHEYSNSDVDEIASHENSGSDEIASHENSNSGSDEIASHESSDVDESFDTTPMITDMPELEEDQGGEIPYITEYSMDDSDSSDRDLNLYGSEESSSSTLKKEVRECKCKVGMFILFAVMIFIASKFEETPESINHRLYMECLNRSTTCHIESQYVEKTVTSFRDGNIHKDIETTFVYNVSYPDLYYSNPDIINLMEAQSITLRGLVLKPMVAPYDIKCSKYDATKDVSNQEYMNRDILDRFERSKPHNLCRELFNI